MSSTALFNLILSLSFMGSILALIIILIKGLLKNKLSANWHYCIWFVLVIRLILPYTPESSLSIFNIASSVSQRIEIFKDINSNININTNISASTKDVETTVYKNNGANTNNSIKNEPVKSGITAVPKGSSIGINYETASIVWLIGMVVMLLYIIIINSVFLLKIKRKPRCIEEGILRNFDQCRSEINVHVNIPIIYDGSSKTPLLFGVIRSKLLIPYEIINNLSEDEKRYLFLHELAHLKRRDILMNWIVVFIQAIHWFNPVVWYAFYRMREDCEVACDAYVLSQLKPLEYKRYGETIINMVSKISKPYWNPVTTGMANDKSSIKRRIEMIAMFKRNTWKWSAIAIVLLIGISIVGLTGAKGAANANNKDNTNILSKNTIDFNKDSHNESLIVKMTDGRYYEDTNPGPYMGSNWEGRFNIQVINDKGNVISELDLNKAFNEQELSFQGDFSVEFEDYNNDGNIDFTIGQYASSNGNIYKLFTILPDGRIEPLIVKGQSEIFSSGGNRYSKKFEKIGVATIKNQYYDNSKGKTVETYYAWSNNENQFIIKPIDGPVEKGANDTQGDWIKSTTPHNGTVNLQPKSIILIEFNLDMDESTLNINNIIIVEEKHSRNISGMFKYDYSPNTKVLSIKFKNPESDYGTGNTVNITVTGKVKNSKGEEMGKYYVFGFEVGQSAINQNSNLYTNTQYGFSFSLPDSWKGYSIVNGKWEGLSLGDQNGETVVKTGPLLSIRHPLWTAQNPRQDIPIMVFTLDQWNSLQQGVFHIGAAPINPSELGRNSRYVFALPARYNYVFPEGYVEVENILKDKSLHTTQ